MADRESPEVTDAYHWQGRTVLDADGEKLGKIEAVYLDKEIDEPAWALIHTGLLGRKLTFVPLANAAPAGEHVGTRVSAERVKSAPQVEPGEELSPEREAELYRHYGSGQTDDDDTEPEGGSSGGT